MSAIPISGGIAVNAATIRVRHGGIPSRCLTVNFSHVVRSLIVTATLSLQHGVSGPCDCLKAYCAEITIKNGG
jgi:hypothetical protein